jgi:hypothetical protein
MICKIYKFSSHLKFLILKINKNKKFLFFNSSKIGEEKSINEMLELLK